MKRCPECARKVAWGAAGGFGRSVEAAVAAARPAGGQERSGRRTQTSMEAEAKGRRARKETGVVKRACVRQRMAMRRASLARNYREVVKARVVVR